MQCRVVRCRVVRYRVVQCSAVQGLRAAEPVGRGGGPEGDQEDELRFQVKLDFVSS